MRALRLAAHDVGERVLSGAMGHHALARRGTVRGVDPERTSPRLQKPPTDLFAPLAEQWANVRRWNQDRGWGIRQAEFDAIDLSPPPPRDPLVVDVLAVYLDAGGGLDGVRRTCHELWTIASQRQPNSWSWDWYWDGWRNYPKPVRLLDGLVHSPGVRRVTIDLGAHWVLGRHIRAGTVRGRNSAHAEVLAAAAHSPAWVRAMDGTRVPHVLLSGYQVTIPEYSSHNRLPCLAWTTFRRQISLTVDWADHSHAGWAAPVRVG